MKTKEAKEFLDGLNAVKEKALADKRSHAEYWNGDDWGSISGFKDAQKWIEDQQIDYVIDYMLKNSTR